MAQSEEVAALKKRGSSSATVNGVGKVSGSDALGRGGGPRLVACSSPVPV